MKRRQKTISKTGILLFGTLCLCLSLFGSRADGANINIGLNIPLPPAFRIAAPPPMVVIPGTYVYAVPDIDIDVFFFRGAWYRPHEGHWFRGSSYNGPWRSIAPDRVPRQVVALPHYDYRRVPPGHDRIPYGHLKRNWKGWERNRHWERKAAWHQEWQRRDDRDGRPGNGGPGRPDRDWKEGQGPQGHENRGHDGHRGPEGHGGPQGR